MNDISEATGASDFEEVIPLLQREIPGLRVYEIEDEEDGKDERDDDGEEEPSLDDFRDVEGKNCHWKCSLTETGVH